MKTSLIHTCQLALLATLMGIVPLQAGDPSAADKAANDRATKEFEKGAKEADRAYDRMQSDKTKESMRDKTHDGRVKTGKDTSVGGSVDKDKVEVNTKTGF